MQIFRKTIYIILCQAMLLSTISIPFASDADNLSINTPNKETSSTFLAILANASNIIDTKTPNEEVLESSSINVMEEFEKLWELQRRAPKHI